MPSDLTPANEAESRKQFWVGFWLSFAVTVGGWTAVSTVSGLMYVLVSWNRMFAPVISPALALLWCAPFIAAIACFGMAIRRRAEPRMRGLVAGFGLQVGLLILLAGACAVIIIGMGAINNPGGGDGALPALVITLAVLALFIAWVRALLRR